MKEKLEWLVLLIPGILLTTLIVSGIFGNGPQLQEIPEKLVAEKKAENIETTVAPIPVKTENTNKTKDKAKAVKLSYTGPKNGYKDGTYYGSAAGFGGTIQVAVTVKEGKIVKVAIVSAAGETPSYLKKASSITGKIVAAQSPNVDVVSGATYSSNGIINATIAALRQAGATNLNSKSTKSNNTKVAPTKQPDKKKNTTKKKTDLTDAEYANGTYYGSGEGYGGTIKVKVEIKNNKIASIQIVSAPYETPEYLNRAKALLSTMIKKQTAQVDVISGATYSSNGIIDAVYEALKESAEKNSKKKTPTPAPTPKPEKAEPSIGEDEKSEPVATSVPGEVTILEDGSTCVETKTAFSKDITGTAMCVPDEMEDFDCYSIDLILSVEGENRKRVITKDGVETSEEETTYTVTNLAFSEATQTGSAADGNWFYLKRAANGFGTKTGVFAQLLLPKKPEEVDVVSTATCSSKAILQAYENAIGQLKK